MDPTPRDTERDDTERDETATERFDRNWDELLQELRVTQTGVQILAGFLLTIPFQQRFADLTDGQRTAYLVALATAVLATTLLVAPVSAHRLLFRKRAKQELVRLADASAQAGLVALAATIVTVTWLILDVVVGKGPALVAAGLALLLFLVNWLLVPLLVRSRLDRT
ncbi:membrane protein [Knoellia flava TL1]|uniref:Sodium:proton antiporter n=2 Tax=Knoellia flava TaxID=913969 RepID=A0A8H9KSB0_9MICO|nr:DUF6328 family protein [Knoellia flava]KGN30449.1 membrane protein [Knoellia flava TL1]GGB65460.1 hypothetical protein GCM10011314_00820 [Knoellia flava]